MTKLFSVIRRRLFWLVICRQAGHTRPWVAWYERGWDKQTHHCKVCGLIVSPQVDWSGHP